MSVDELWEKYELMSEKDLMKLLLTNPMDEKRRAIESVLTVRRLEREDRNAKWHLIATWSIAAIAILAIIAQVILGLFGSCSSFDHNTISTP